MGLLSETRVDFGYMVRLWAFGLYVRESIANAGMHDSFGIVQLSGNPGKSRDQSRSTVRPAREVWRPGGSGIFCFPLS